MDGINSGLFPFFVAFCFVFGLFIGSFLNVCIYRLPLGKSIVLPGSHCYRCGSFIRWHDNVPVVSYLLLRGRCRTCGEPFSARYLVVEVLTAILFALVFYYYGFSLTTLVYFGVVGLFIIAIFTDLDHWIIPDQITLGGTLFIVLATLAVSWDAKGLLVWKTGPFSGNAFFVPVLNAAIGALVGFVVLWIIMVGGRWVFGKEVMGGGDVKLFALVGAVLGWIGLFYVLALSAFLGSLVGLMWALFRSSKKHVSTPEKLSAEGEEAEEEEWQVIKKGIKGVREAEQRTSLGMPIPYGPFISVATLVVLIFYTHLARWFYPLAGVMLGGE